MHLVCRCSLPVWRRSFLKKGTPRDLFWPRPGSAPGRIWPKNNNTCKGPWVLHAYQVSSKSIKWFWRRSRKCEKFTLDGRRRRTTDGRTDDGRCAMTIAHSSLWLSWANKKCRFCFLFIQKISWSSEDPIATGTLSAILDFSREVFAYWRSIREVYRVIDRLHVTCFIQSVFDILVRGEINGRYISGRQCLCCIIYGRYISGRQGLCCIIYGRYISGRQCLCCIIYGRYISGSSFGFYLPPFRYE